MEQTALLEFWQGCSRLAFKIAMQYLPTAECNGAADRDDLEQCAFLGFLEAVRAFDPDKRKFSTYLVPCVRTACRRLLGLSGRVRQEHYCTISLDTPIGDGITLADTLSDEDTPFQAAEDEADRVSLRRDLLSALDRIPQGELIRLHDLEALPLQEAAKASGAAPLSARNARREGLRKLRSDPAMRKWHDDVRVYHKGVKAFMTDWTSVVEAEVIRRNDRGIAVNHTKSPF